MPRDWWDINLSEWQCNYVVFLFSSHHSTDPETLLIYITYIIYLYYFELHLTDWFILHYCINMFTCGCYMCLLYCSVSISLRLTHICLLWDDKLFISENNFQEQTRNVLLSKNIIASCFWWFFCLVMIIVHLYLYNTPSSDLFCLPCCCML